MQERERGAPIFVLSLSTCIISLKTFDCTTSRLFTVVDKVMFKVKFNFIFFKLDQRSLAKANSAGQIISNVMSYAVFAKK